METEIDVAAKRMQASANRGVSYDARIDRFTAEIWAGGVRRWLGSYGTAGEAASAYQRAAEERGPVVRSQTSFNACYAAFREAHGGDRTDPPVGSRLEYDGQAFTYTGKVWRKVNGAKVFFVWESRCKTCSAPYKTMTPAPVSMAKGISRNCHEHVTKGKPGLGRAKRKDYGAAFTIGERALVAVEGLGLLADRVALSLAVETVASAVGSSAQEAELVLRGIVKKGAANNRPVTFAIEGGEVVFTD